MKFSLRLRIARPSFYIISENPNVSLGIVDCSLYTRRFALEDDYHKEKKDLLAFTPVGTKCLETLAKSLIIPVRQIQVIQQNF